MYHGHCIIQRSAPTTLRAPATTSWWERCVRPCGRSTDGRKKAWGCCRNLGEKRGRVSRWCLMVGWEAVRWICMSVNADGLCTAGCAICINRVPFWASVTVEVFVPHKVIWTSILLYRTGLCSVCTATKKLRLSKTFSFVPLTMRTTKIGIRGASVLIAPAPQVAATSEELATLV